MSDAVSEIRGIIAAISVSGKTCRTSDVVPMLQTVCDTIEHLLEKNRIVDSALTRETVRHGKTRDKLAAAQIENKKLHDALLPSEYNHLEIIDHGDKNG